MKKQILSILIGIFTILLLISIAYFTIGSLEMYPTNEQIEKARIFSFATGIIHLVAVIALIYIRNKMNDGE